MFARLGPGSPAKGARSAPLLWWCHLADHWGDGPPAPPQGVSAVVDTAYRHTIIGASTTLLGDMRDPSTEAQPSPVVPPVDNRRRVGSFYPHWAASLLVRRS